MTSTGFLGAGGLPSFFTLSCDLLGAAVALLGAAVGVLLAAEVVAGVLLAGAFPVLSSPSVATFFPPGLPVAAAGVLVVCPGLLVVAAAPPLPPALGGCLEAA